MAMNIRKTTKGKNRNFLSTKEGAGMTAKGVAAYRRANPGSKLQTAVTEKNPSPTREKRRKAFCSRMRGVVAKAKGPAERAKASLKRWRC
jgi:hypothetical protein